MSVRRILADALSRIAGVAGGTARRLRSQQQVLDHCRIAPGAVLTPTFSVDVRNPAISGEDIIVGERAFLQCALVLEQGGATIRIGAGVFIGNDSLIIASRSIEIGDGAQLSWRVTVVDHDSHSLSWHQRSDDTERARHGYLQTPSNVSLNKDWSTVPAGPVSIGPRAWIGFGVTILKGVTIGEGAIIGAGSVVTGDVAPWTVVAGNPARQVRELTAEERGESCAS